MKSFPWDSIILGKDERTGYAILDRQAKAADLREIYSTFFTNGVFVNEPDSLQVSPGEAMNVVVSPGRCCINGTVGIEVNQRGLAIQAADATSDRIDTVVLRWNANVEVRSIDLYVKTGVAQSVPVRPTLTRSETVWELGLCDIFIAKGSGAISAARITDTRLDKERCGVVSPLLEVDTTSFYEQLREQTQIAVDLAQAAIDGTVAGDLQKQITENKTAIGNNKSEIDSTNESLTQAEGRIGNVETRLSGSLFQKNLAAFTFNIAANATASLTAQVTKISGYTPVAVAYITTTRADVIIPCSWDVGADGKANLTLYNRYGAAVSGTGWTTILHIKDPL